MAPNVEPSSSDDKDEMEPLEYQIASCFAPVRPKNEKARIWKNIIIISVGFLFNFNAFQGLSRLQSSLHKEEGLGTGNNAIIYAGIVVSCIFIPKPLINLIGHKWTIPLCFCGYIAWMAANGYAVWATFIPAATLVGLSAAPLWTAQCAYFTKIAGRYAKITNQTEQAVVTIFFGCFFFFFQLSSLTGSIISSTILSPKYVNQTGETAPSEEALQYCGIKDCPDNPDNITNPNLEKPPSEVVWTMLGVYIGVAFSGVLLVSLTVDNLPKELQDEKKKGCSEISGLLLVTLSHLKKPAQCILIPLTMYSGFEQAFYNAEFTKSFVTCGLGIWKVGLVTLPYAAVNACVSFTSGNIVRFTGRLPIFIAGFVVDLAIQITLMLWMPHPDKEYVLYILASMWGFTDGIWQTQLNSLYGCIFPDSSEAAFSNYRMWESMGFIIAFAYSQFICTSYKLYVVTTMLCLGMIGYFIVEWQIYKKKDKDGDLSPTENGKVTGLEPKASCYVKTNLENQPVYNFDNKAFDGIANPPSYEESQIVF